MASEKITAIIDSVKELSVLELKELIDAYCEEFGVSAVAAAAPAAAGAAASAEEEKTEFDVILAEAGANFRNKGTGQPAERLFRRCCDLGSELYRLDHRYKPCTGL